MRHMPVSRSSVDRYKCLKQCASRRPCHMMPSTVTSLTLDSYHSRRCTARSLQSFQLSQRRTHLNPYTDVAGCDIHRHMLSSMLPIGPRPPNRRSAAPGRSCLGLRTRSSKIDYVSVELKGATRRSRSKQDMMTMRTMVCKHRTNRMSLFQYRQSIRNYATASETLNRRNMKCYMSTRPTRDHSCRCCCYMSLSAPHFHLCMSDTGCGRLIHLHKWPSMSPTLTKPTKRPSSCCMKQSARQLRHCTSDVVLLSWCHHHTSLCTQSTQTTL